MDDANYPWLVLVPRVGGASELIDLDIAQQSLLLEEIVRVSHVLQRLFAPDKLNTAALGNLVPQLHVHVVARSQADAAWPRPVWGAVPPKPYAAEERERLLARLRDALMA